MRSTLLLGIMLTLGTGTLPAQGTVTIGTGDQDFSAQLTNIGAAGCDIFFTPQYYSEVPLIVASTVDLHIRSQKTTCNWRPHSGITIDAQKPREGTFAKWR